MNPLGRRIIALIPLLLTGALRAGSFSVSPWTNDASTGIVEGQTAWAYRFGDPQAFVLNGVTVMGVAGPTETNQNFELTGTASVFPDDTNSLTNLGGTGSSELARNFVYGGNPASVQLKGLTPGQAYTVSFFSVGWSELQERRQTFISQTDVYEVDQGVFGGGEGLRVDYAFTATSATRFIDILPVIPDNTFHLYGLALRQTSNTGGPLVVSNGFDSGAGSLRQALLHAATTPGAATVTFAAGFTGPVQLTAEIGITDPDGVTVDATAAIGGMTITGNDTTRLFTVNAGTTLTLMGLTLTGGNGSGGSGGALVNHGNATLDLCTISDNHAGSGGAILCESGSLRLTRCTLSDNSTAGSGSGGAIHCSVALTLTQCTFTGNQAGAGGAVRQQGGTATLLHCTFSNNGAQFGGGVATASNAAMDLIHCTVSANTAAVNGGGLMNLSSRLTLTHCVVHGNTAPANQGKDIFNTGFSPGTVTRVGANLLGPLVNEFSSTDNGPAPIIGDPLLLPLAGNGGPTQTMALQSGSPAIQAAVGSASTTDQRGYFLNGTADLGAYEFSGVDPASLLVTHAGDAGPGSLRGAVANAAAAPGPHTVTFAPGVSGPIVLAGEITIDDTSGGVTVDARNLPQGATVHGNLAGRVFHVAPGANAILLRLVIAGGRIGGGFPSGYGGGVLVEGMLLLEECTLSSNTAFAGGGAAVVNNGAANLILRRCTVSDNTAEFGGGIQNEGTLTCLSSTFAGNSASQVGGAVSAPFSHPVTLEHCTLAYNVAADGGGVSGDAITLQRSILTGNTAPIGADASGSLTASGSLVGSETRLGPLLDCGGPTATIPLRPGSAARNAATGSTVPLDQRGFPRVDTPDIGAYETGSPDAAFNAFIWESLPVSANVLQYLPSVDFDGDGQTNTEEWRALTDPANPASLLRIAQVQRLLSSLTFTFPSRGGRAYILQQSDSLLPANWEDTPGFASIPGTGGNVNFTVSLPPPSSRIYRLQARPAP